MRTPLVASLSSDGPTPSVNWSGDGTLFAYSGFTASGDSIYLEISVDGGNYWFPATDDTGLMVTLIADGAINFSVGNCKVRAVLVNSNLTTIYIQIQPR